MAADFLAAIAFVKALSSGGRFFVDFGALSNLNSSVRSGQKRI
ncbi:MAG: hypothetical protein QG632_375 [Candidatus Dependentiae bacterium]|nr:hypothetical protein [Candidatus Dependentiae bacterium]